MMIIRRSRPSDGTRIIEIWRSAVDATHDFLSPEDRLAIDEMICGFLPQAPLWLMVDAFDYPLAFMLIDDAHMERCSSIPRIVERVSVLRLCATASHSIQK